ncbi:S8 family peptidase [Erysipelotrichia bacterium]
MAGEEDVVFHTAKNGIYLEFKGEAGYELATKSLENLSGRSSENWTRLLNVRKEKQITDGEEKEVTYATVFVPKHKKDELFRKIEKYATENNQYGNPCHAGLLESIANIQKADHVFSFWQDHRELIPENASEWCEIWLSSDKREVIRNFENLLDERQIAHKPGFLIFPERAVKVALVNKEQLTMLTSLSDNIAEYRRAKETAAFWIGQANKEQALWNQSILDRLEVSTDSKIAVCILDTGVNNGHPLLKPVLDDSDCQAVDDEWGSHDHDKHGTLMAGVSAYGNLQEALASNKIIKLLHRLESVKILPPSGANNTALWGDITAQGIYKAEIQAPESKRIACMAVSANDTRDMGRPSSWSGAIDQLCSGAEDRFKRLVVICAGNTDISEQSAEEFPGPQLANFIHDPGQAWNALTVGAYTDLEDLTDTSLKGYLPLAKRGGLSPFSSTSLSWEDAWPIKPEVLFEGGNAAKRGSFITECDDLSVLSTYFKPQTAHFYPFAMTSAATAKAAWFAAQVQAQYSDYWPETIRGLIVHSAEWTPEMLSMFLENDSKASYRNLLRICGYGVPDLERALFSAGNNLTLISQQEIQPFKKEGSSYKANDMHLYELPWPKDVLLELPPDTVIQMRVTLSYFIEPGPGEIGWKNRYRYASHGLRFFLNSPGEDRDLFIRRVNLAARDEENGHPGTGAPTDYWTFGQTVNKGSIHSDIWRGSAQDLATSNLIAVAPVIGWWRERSHLNKFGETARYALIVSITTPEQNVDIYTPVAIKLGIQVPVEITNSGA